MRKIYVRQVEAFRAVVTLGSMSKAAELLGISQPAVSRLMADFQEAVGFKLFKRKRNSAEPTPDARQLFEQVEKLFYGFEELNDQIAAIKNVHMGRLTISATSSFATGMLPTVIAEFKRSYANVAISLHIQSHDQVIDWVTSGRADIGFAIQPVANTDLSTLTLASRAAHCILPAGHELAGKDGLHPSDLSGLPYVSFPRGTPLRFQIDSVFDRLGVDRLLHIEATSHHAVCALVSSGLGVALVNPFAPISGYPTDLMAKPMKPSVLIELRMLWNEDSTSISSTRFCDFARAYVERLVGLGENERGTRSPRRSKNATKSEFN